MRLDAVVQPDPSRPDAARRIVERLRELFANELDILVPDADTDLLATGLLDSLGLVELLARTEQTFGLRIDFEELEIESFRSLRSIAELIAARLVHPSTGAPPSAA